jgi:hypothetical protein
MTLPLTVPGDPQTDPISISLTIPQWIYWRVISTAEQIGEDKEHLFYVGLRAAIADPATVEAIAFKNAVQRLVNERLSDAEIGGKLGIPARRVRDIRRAFSIPSQARRGKKAAVVTAVVVAA